MSDARARVLVSVCSLALLLLFIAGVVAWGWYRAGVQQEVYRRQGVEMSQWEVYMGAKPIERRLITKEDGR